MSDGTSSVEATGGEAQTADERLGQPPRVRLRDVSKSFGLVHALRGVSMDVMPGSIHGIVGQNGAGKSTLINVLSGVVHPDHGTIELDGERLSIRSPEYAQELGIQTIHQELHLVPSLTVAENISLGVEPTSHWRLLARREMSERARAALGTLGRPDVLPGARVEQLTIGDQQIVEIARALRMEARLLILDEPTSALPTHAFETLCGVLRRFRGAGGSAIYVSHRFHEVLEICDRIAVFRDGQLVQTVEPSEVDEHRLAELTVGRRLEAVFPSRPTFSDQADSDTVLELTGLSGRRLERLNLKVRPGRIFGVTGLEGSGIRELGRILAGDVRPSAGAIRMRGRPLRLRSPLHAARSGIAYVTSDRLAEGLFLTLSVAHNIAAPSLHRRRRFGLVDRRGEAEVVRSALGRFDIRGSTSQFSGALSGGNQQKVLLARALPQQPQLFVLDEPTRGVDVATRSDIYAELRSLVSDGASVIVISTDVQEVTGLCDDIVVLRGGQLVLTCEAPVDEAIVARAVSGSAAHDAGADGDAACSNRDGEVSDA